MARYYAKLDLNKNFEAVFALPLFTGDSGNTVRLEFYQDGHPYDMSGAQIYARRSDGTVLTTAAVTSGNRAEFTLYNNMFSCLGELQVQVSVLDVYGNFLTSGVLYFTVQEGFSSQSQGEGSDDFCDLTALIRQVSQGIGQLERAEAAADTVEELAPEMQSFLSRFSNLEDQVISNLTQQEADLLIKGIGLVASSETTDSEGGSILTEYQWPVVAECSDTFGSIEVTQTRCYNGKLERRVGTGSESSVAWGQWQECFATNIKNGSSVGSLRTSGSKAEGTDYTVGQYALAEGYGTGAAGFGSHSEGLGTIAAGEAQHTQGKYNIEDSTSAFVIGNGTGDTDRSNAMTVDWDGNLQIAGDLSAQNVYTKTEIDSKIVPSFDLVIDFDTDLSQYAGQTISNKIIFFKGGQSTESSISITFSGCTIYGNRKTIGTLGNLIFTGCTIYDLNVRQCIVWGDETNDYTTSAGGCSFTNCYISGGSAFSYWDPSFSGCKVYHCSLEGYSPTIFAKNDIFMECDFNNASITVMDGNTYNIFTNCTNLFSGYNPLTGQCFFSGCSGSVSVSSSATLKPSTTTAFADLNFADLTIS